MALEPFKLERYFARWEFTAPYLLCSSDLEPYRLPELLALADEDGLARWQDLSLGYTEYPGLPALREEIAGLYTTASPAEVFTFAGAEEAIFALMQALVRPGDHVVATWPGYQSLYEVARSLGAEVTFLRLAPEAGWTFDLATLRRALRPTTRLLVLNFPHNPTGALLSEATWRGVVALAEETGVCLFSDEVYRLLEYDEAQRLPAAVDLGRRAVSLGVMSKAFGLAGLRVGWVATHDAELLRRLSAVKDYLSICNSAPSEILALIALRARQAVLGRNRALLASNLALLDAFFAEWGEVFTWVRPRAGSVGFPSLRLPLPVAQFAAELVAEEGVLVLPGSVYDFPGNHFRLGFGRRNLPEALARLRSFAVRRWR
jgi:aspartate/methionine/tyrosine aminotransferase